jgi:iron complex outermembrane recepter protein
MFSIFNRRNTLGVVFLVGLPYGLAGEEADALGPAYDLSPVLVHGSLVRAMEDFAQPILFLDREGLAQIRQSSLGETLGGLPGISSTSYFPGASRPVVRGFSNHRIRILRNGVDTIDASAGSLDHAVAIEPYRLEEIEIVRGPATLLYGGGAVGGVVNTIDNMVPRTPADRPVVGRGDVSFDSASEGTTGSFSLQVGGLPVEVAVGGLRRRTGDISIPGFGAVDPELQAQQRRGTLANSHVNTDEFFVGATRFLSSGWLGGAASRFRTNYGLGLEVSEEVVGVAPDGSLLIARELEDRVTIDLDQKRLDLRGELVGGLGFVESLSWRGGVADYEHRELEDGEEATVFRNRGFEGRIEAAHRPLGELNGAFGLELSQSKFEATGDEAFLRPTETWKVGLFGLEEWELEPLTWQLGARVDYHTISPERYDRDDLGQQEPALDRYRQFGYSGALGVVWDFAPQWQTGWTASYTERLLHAQELYADGPHVGTFAYERSDQVDGGDFSKERAFGLDMVVRRTAGAVTAELSGFAQLFPRFVNLRRTGELAFGNQDGTFTIMEREQVNEAFLEDREGRQEENEFLQVTRYQLSRALFLGAEAEVTFHLLDQHQEGPTLDWTWQADWVWTEDRKEGDALPRIPPLRFGMDLAYENRGFYLVLDGRHSMRQSRTARFEEESPSYTLVGLGAGRSWVVDGVEWSTFVRLANLLDEEVRPHTSFVRDFAPLPGRNVTAGLSLAF